MWPLARGSVQPMKCPPVALKQVSLSAPQLSFERVKPPKPSRLDCFPPISPSSPPQRCQNLLLNQSQLTDLRTLPAEAALSSLIGWLPEDTPSNHKNTIAILLLTVIRWCLKNNFDSKKASVLLTIYFNTYKFFLSSPWTNQSETYWYFKESLLLHSVDHSPRSVRVFAPQECQDCLLFFSRNHLTVLPLARLKSLPNFRIRLLWDATDSITEIEV